jgi:ATP-dependent DNA helicase DinG
MVVEVARSLESGTHLLVQAGTGTGKSLAYLTPALLVDGPVVVSTATLALQNQLVAHDLPRLADAVEPILGRRPTFAVLKGRHHYLCVAKMEHADEEEPTDTLFDDAPPRATQWLGEAGRLGKQIQRLQAWADKTATGDRDELDPGVDDTAWRQVSMPARDCVGAGRCPYGAECFAEASRARAREADIVVTNHSLLAVDMLADRNIVPPHRLLIVDEAHELADRVSSAAQAELTPEAIERAAKRARPLISPAAAESLAEAADALTVGLGDAPSGRLTTGLPPLLHRAVLLLDGATRSALEAVGEVKSDDPDPVRKQQAKATLDDLSGTAQRLLELSDHDVAWVEKSDLGNGRRALVVAPLSVAGTLATNLYDDRTVVATSATLTLGGRFDTVARSLGLPTAKTAAAPAPTAPACPTPPARSWSSWSPRSAAAPSACSRPARRRPRPPSCSAPARTCRCCCRARSRCRSWSASSARTGRAVCSASCRCGRASTCPATPASWSSSTGSRFRARTSRSPRPARQRWTPRAAPASRQSACRSRPYASPRASAA